MQHFVFDFFECVKIIRASQMNATCFAIHQMLTFFFWEYGGYMCGVCGDRCVGVWRVLSEELRRVVRVMHHT